MSPSKSTLHPSGIYIQFYPDSHRYTDSRGCTYDSVSHVLKSLFKPFDSATIAARVAAREGRPVADVLADWAAKGSAACRLGTRAHAVAEAAVLGLDPRAALSGLTGDAAGEPEPESPRERAAFAAAWAAAQTIRAGCASVHPEAILADPESLTAGTTDLVGIRRPATPVGDDGGVTVLDYKTSDHIDAESRYGDRALEPYSHLHDCHLVKYSLQLHLYRWMMVNCGYLRPTETTTLYIVHLAPDATDPTWIVPLDLSAEADHIMSARRRDLEQVHAMIAQPGFIDPQPEGNP